MHLNSEEFEAFLRTLGVELENSDARAQHCVHGEPTITLLQHSRHHEAFYRVDLIETRPHLLVLIPAKQVPLKFYHYLVRLSEAHPFAPLLAHLASYRGSGGFEQEREFAEWQLLHTIVETMKVLFWRGLENPPFPQEIIVQHLL